MIQPLYLNYVCVLNVAVETVSRALFSSNYNVIRAYKSALVCRFFFLDLFFLFIQRKTKGHFEYHWKSINWPIPLLNWATKQRNENILWIEFFDHVNTAHKPDSQSSDTQSQRNFIHFTLPLFDFILYAQRTSKECFSVISLCFNKVERKQEPSKRATKNNVSLWLR